MTNLERGTRRPRVRVLATALTVLSTVALGLSASPASAQRLGLTDPARDADGAGLDVTRAALVNDDYAIRVRVAFAEAVRGDLVVSIDRRKGHGLRLVSQHRPRGTTRNYVLHGAFTDEAGGGKARCRGFRVRWDAEAGTATLRLPSRCFADDHYGAVRFAVLTERAGSDTDYAPDPVDEDGGDLGVSAWVPRG